MKQGGNEYVQIDKKCKGNESNVLLYGYWKNLQERTC